MAGERYSGLDRFSSTPTVPTRSARREHDCPSCLVGSDICFEWHGPIADAIRHLEQHDVPVELGPVERPGARGVGQSVYFRDPDGSLLEFITYGRE